LYAALAGFGCSFGDGPAEEREQLGLQRAHLGEQRRRQGARGRFVPQLVSIGPDTNAGGAEPLDHVQNHLVAQASGITVGRSAVAAGIRARRLVVRRTQPVRPIH
jgi:hypothetical protein